MSVTLLESDDGRILTEPYQKDGKLHYSLAEKTAKGTLITEFNEHSEVINQVYNEASDHQKALLDYLGLKEKKLVLSGSYKGILINAKCRSCSKSGLRRVLDLMLPSKIEAVPVVPLFFCLSCRSPHYSLTDDYLKVLVHSKEALFEPDEAQEVQKDPHGSIKLLQEYIIRIFASKKISRIRIE